MSCPPSRPVVPITIGRSKEGRSTMSEKSVEVVGGVDTHRDVHVAAAVAVTGQLLGTASFPATNGGYGELLAWLGVWGEAARVGIEGTGSYGAGLARYLTAAGLCVVDSAAYASEPSSTPAPACAQTRQPIPSWPPPRRRCAHSPGASGRCRPRSPNSTPNSSSCAKWPRRPARRARRRRRGGCHAPCHRRRQPAPHA